MSNGLIHIKAFTRKIEERIEPLREKILDGQLSPEEYKRQCGIVRGLEMAIGEARELINGQSADDDIEED